MEDYAMPQVLTSGTDPDDIDLRTLLAALEPAADLPLVFSYDGRDVKPGYHVTEVKAGQFAALDCGANPESWSEMFIQLWDVNEDRSHMLAGRFLKIIGKVIDHLDLDRSARLTFEVSDGIRPIQLHRAALPRVDGGAVRVALSPRPASCKPRDRWLLGQAPGTAMAGGNACCG